MEQRERGVDEKMRLVTWIDEEEERKSAWILDMACKNCLIGLKGGCWQELYSSLVAERWHEKLKPWV